MHVPVTCLCGAAAQNVVLGRKTLASGTSMCHCNSCRHATGVLCVSTLSLTSPPALDGLTKYESSNHLSRYFCETCGSHVFTYNANLSEWAVLSGGIEGPEPTSLTYHKFVADTVDGGLSIYLSAAEDGKLPVFAQGPDGKQIGVDQFPDISNSLRDSEVKASCHCGGVQYILTRPNTNSEMLSSPWPDLLIPSASSHSENEDDVKWWLRADGSKYLAGTCACRSCRLSSGSIIQTWAFVPKVNLLNLAGSTIDFELGTLRRFESSPGVYREFCCVCGALAFWHCDIRPALIDVSVGLIRSQSGARAESILEWHKDRVSFAEEAENKIVITSLLLGLRDSIKAGL